MDLSRPVLDTSGYSHRVIGADLYDSHDYIDEKDWTKGYANFQKRHSEMTDGTVYVNAGTKWVGAVCRPAVLWFPSSAASSGCWEEDRGGIEEAETEKIAAVVTEAEETEAGDAIIKETEMQMNWGYGGNPVSVEDYYHRFQAVCDTLLDNPFMFGYCYTQLTDIPPELNGIYTYDRRLKFDAARLKAIQEKQAAIEK